MPTPLTAPAGKPAPAKAVDPAKVTPKKAEVVKSSEAAKNQLGTSRIPAAAKYGDSPIKGQYVASKGKERLPQPLVLVPMSGRYQGMTYKVGEWLGVAANEISQSYGANWEEVASGIYVPNVNFKSLTQEKFSVTLAFHSDIADVAHLTEGLKHLREISDDTTSPPILLYKQGSMKCFVVLTSVSVKYSYPNGGKPTTDSAAGLGFKYAESVSLEFIQVAALNGGFGGTSRGGPLTSTPQESIASKLTDKQRKQLSQRTIIDAAIGDCMPPESTAQIKRLIKEDKLSDPSALLALDASAFVSLAIAQKIPSTLYASNPQILKKLEVDLAIFIAQQEDGVQRTPGKVAPGVVTNGFAAPRNLANYYIASNADAPAKLARLGPDLQSQAPNGRKAYQDILAAIKTPEGVDKTPDLRKDQTGNRLSKRSFACALNLARADLSSISGVQLTNDPAVIAKLAAFKDRRKALTEDDLKAAKTAFGLTGNNDVKKLFAILPVADRSAFELAVNQAFGRGGRISGTALWSKFAAYTDPPPTTPTPTPPTPTPGV